MYQRKRKVSFKETGSLFFITASSKRFAINFNDDVFFELYAISWLLLFFRDDFPTGCEHPKRVSAIKTCCWRKLVIQNNNIVAKNEQ
jgi:hypothetical protein